MKKFNPQELPNKIKVKILKTRTGKYFAKLPDYDIFTESECREELNSMVNDLIFCFFDVPKDYQSKIWYRPENPRPNDLTKVNSFNILVDPKFGQLFA